MKQRKNIDELFCGKGQENISNLSFRIMTMLMSAMDFFGKHSNKNFQTLGLKTGQTVIDYGCGPARYIRNASCTVGNTGRVIAVDIHPLAIKKANLAIENYGLANVEAVLSSGSHTPLDEKIADVIYALDMFHMVEQPKVLLFELNRLLKDDGHLIIEDGHQPRSETIAKINGANLFAIVSENKSHVRCKKLTS